LDGINQVEIFSWKVKLKSFFVVVILKFEENKAAEDKDGLWTDESFHD